MAQIADARPRVLVVTADEHVASMVRQMLQCDGTYLWCGWATRPEQAVALAAELAADAIVSDVAVPMTQGTALLSELLDAHPDLALVVLTKRTDVHTAVEALRLGVDGYLFYEDGLHRLPEALDRALDGQVAVADRVLCAMTAELGRARPHPKRMRQARLSVDSAAWEAAATITDGTLTDLTPRESQVMSELARGYDNRTISRHLGISDSTVGNHIQRIRQKLGAESREELVTISNRLTTAPVF